MQPIIPGNIIGNSIPLSLRASRNKYITQRGPLQTLVSRDSLSRFSRRRKRTEENIREKNMAGRSSSLVRGPLSLQKKKKKIYDDFFDCFVQHDKYHALETHTINRPSIRADSPLITNKYLTSSLHRVQTLLSTSACAFRRWMRTFQTQREREVFYSFEFVRRRG